MHANQPDLARTISRDYIESYPENYRRQRKPSTTTAVHAVTKILNNALKSNCKASLAIAGIKNVTITECFYHARWNGSANTTHT